MDKQIILIFKNNEEKNRRMLQYIFEYDYLHNREESGNEECV